MPTPSKFTAEAREKALEARSWGGPIVDCAGYAGVSDTTLGRWLEKGRTAYAAGRGGIYADFYVEWLKVSAAPRIRSLRIWHQAMEDKPELAVKFAQAQVQGYAPQKVGTQVAVGSPVIELSFPDTRIVDAELVEGEVIELESQVPGPRSLPAPG